MSRFDRRASRPLIVVLILVVALAAFSIYHNISRDNVQHAAALPVQPLQKPAAPSAPSEPTLAHQIEKPLSNPATRPTTRPYSSLFSLPPDASAQLASSTHPASTEPSLGVVAIAQANIDSGKILVARNELNDALQSGALSNADAQSAKSMIADISKTVVFGKKHFADDPYCIAYTVKPGEVLAKIAAAHDCTWELLSRINSVDAKSLRAGATIKVVQGPFFAVVDKRKFTMDLYLGALPGDKSSMYVETYPVGLGRDDSTPPGTWMIEPHHKLKHPTYYSPRGEGVMAADDPKNPLGGYWIGLTGTDGQAVGKLSYGIHGTIEPDSIGKQSSMGCIRMHNEDVALVFEMLVEGKSLVTVKE